MTPGFAPGSGLCWLESLGPQKIRPGLSRVQALLESLGHPQREYRSVLIAGTNGKGSTAAFLSSILSAAGIRTGLYTSPHLVRVHERVRIAEEDVEDRCLDEVLWLISRISGDGALRPTYFEAMTVAAFEVFRRKGVRVAVVEAGIGGLWDATNVLDPLISIVTNVAEDHLEILGPALSDVARQKAGIFRPGRTALTSAEGEMLAVLETEAKRIGAHLTQVTPSALAMGQRLALPGRHQARNAGLAVAAAQKLAAPSTEVVARGLQAVRWPGRLQWVRREGRRPLLLDGAHNPAGAETLAAYLDEAGLSEKADLVFGALLDKDVEGLFSPLRTRVRKALFVSPPSPRAGPARELAERLGFDAGLAEPGLLPAIARLEREDPASRAPIIVAGSLYLVGEMLRLLGGAPEAV